ncbi:MAG TPA: helix-turn-helix transcriptional regulator [Thermoanaerobaculia bacterium]|nr:helix-turn-helix transcriptional regulator [Thermoanaerobaculia bacterium]
MTNPTPLRYEDVAAPTRGLLVRLKAELKGAGLQPSRLAEALEVSESALARLLADPARLEVRHLYRLLELIACHPADFFVRLRPQRSGRYLPNMKVLAEAARSLPLNFDPLGELAGAGEPRRLAQLLHQRILGAGKTLRAVSVELGFRPDHFAQILRGGVELKVWHVFAVLKLLGESSAAFFDELYGLVDGLPDWQLPGGRRWSELRALAQRLEEELAALDADSGWQDPEEQEEPDAPADGWGSTARTAWDGAGSSDGPETLQPEDWPPEKDES